MKYKFKKRLICEFATYMRYILQTIVMLFLRASRIPVNPQIHANVMCPLFVLKYIF
jgi:hypothetical protein